MNLEENLNKILSEYDELQKKVTSDEVINSSKDYAIISKEISEIDQQINGYKKENEKLTVNISSLNNEILNLENEKPDLSNKISKK